MDSNSRYILLTQEQLIGLRTAVANSGVLNKDQVASHRLLAAETLSSLLEFDQALTGDALDAVLQSLSSELSHLSQASFDSQVFSDSRYVRVCLKVAEKAATNQPGSISRQTELFPLLAQLVNLWPAEVGHRTLSLGMCAVLNYHGY